MVDDDGVHCPMSPHGEARRQWPAEWDAAPGERALTIRTADGEGNPPTSTVRMVSRERDSVLHCVTVGVK
jgi:hypothetical protein